MKRCICQAMQRPLLLGLWIQIATVLTGCTSMPIAIESLRVTDSKDASTGLVRTSLALDVPSGWWSMVQIVPSFGDGWTNYVSEPLSSRNFLLASGHHGLTVTAKRDAVIDGWWPVWTSVVLRGTGGGGGIGLRTGLDVESFRVSEPHVLSDLCVFYEVYAVCKYQKGNPPGEESIPCFQFLLRADISLPNNSEIDSIYEMKRKTDGAAGAGAADEAGAE